MTTTGTTPVWIAGIGAVSAAGIGTPATLAAFRDSVRHPSSTLPFESTISCPTFQVTADLPVLPGRYNNCRTLRLTMLAVSQALAEAGIDGFDAETCVGVAAGTTVASQLNNIPFYEAYRRIGNPPLDAIHDYLHANLAQAVGDLLQVTGPRMTIVNACSSGTDAIGVAASWIHAGLCDVAIAGGGDELNRVALAGFWSLGVYSSEPCAPFDRDRAGLNLGEGAGILVLESDRHARRRGRKNACQVAGFGTACDAHHLTAPHPEGRGLHTAISCALGQGQIGPAQVAFINAHGTATADNDRAEGKVLARIFGPEVRFLSTKGYTGHTLGAAGGLEAAFTVLGLCEGWIPASMGFENPADDIPVAPIRERTAIGGEYAMSTSLAFGGNNSAVLIRRIA
jgi:3-oxoacyl-(acyl-carrier-protein) synthase